jgi:uncharacterized membrane protein YbhN (UPF0104 family)
MLRLALGLVLVAAVTLLFVWRGSSLAGIGDAFSAVRWWWVAAAVALNLLSVIVRALAWTIVIRCAIPPPHPAAPLVFSAFSVGLFANAVLPGRIGELARVAVLTRKLPTRKGIWATLVGTVFAHRVFDLIPVLLLVPYVVVTANVPNAARASLLAVTCIGVVLFAFAFVSGRRPHALRFDGLGPARRLLAMGRQGLGIMRSPGGTAAAVFSQTSGWVCQLFAVLAAMRAFDIHSGLPTAGVVLLLMNVVTIFPFWPGNVGLTQVAIASALTGYGVAYAHGIAYGLGLQAIEASVGIGAGLVFFVHEGVSLANLKLLGGELAAGAQADGHGASR